MSLPACSPTSCSGKYGQPFVVENRPGGGLEHRRARLRGSAARRLHALRHVERSRWSTTSSCSSQPAVQSGEGFRADHQPVLQHAGLRWSSIRCSRSRPCPDLIALAVQAHVTDAVIDAAALAMPMEYPASVPKLRPCSSKRRAALPKAANQYYRCSRPGSKCTGPTRPIARSSRVRVTAGGRRLESRGHDLLSRGASMRERRRRSSSICTAATTRRVVSGHVQQSIPVRIIGGNGTNTFIDSSTVAGQRHAARLYDSGTVAGVSYGPDTMFDRRPWETRNGALAPPGRDVGTTHYRPAWDSAITVASASRRVSASRSTRTDSTVAHMNRWSRSMASTPPRFAARASRSGGSAIGIVANPLRGHRQSVRFRSHQLQRLRKRDPDSGGTNPYFAVHQRQWMFHPAVALAVGSTTDISLGPVIQHAVRDSARSPYLAAARPYGFGSFTQAGMQLGARYEWQRRPTAKSTRITEC